MPLDDRDDKRKLIVGRSGELAAMSELLWRGWTPARPEIDIGDDVFIVDDEDGTFWRIQVKTATASQSGKSGQYKAQFGLRLDQLQTAPTPDLYYVFVVRAHERWSDFVIVPRARLREEHEAFEVGSATNKNKLTLNLYFRSREILAGTSHGVPQRDWTRYRDLWPRVGGTP